MPRFVNPNPYHTPATPPTTPLVPDPTGGSTIDALMARAKAARDAQAQPMPAQIASPWQGASMMVNRLAEGLQARGAEEQANIGRADLAKAMALPTDPNTGMPTQEAMATITARNPEMGQQLYLAGIAARQKANAMEHFTTLTPDEVKAAGLDPARQYQRSSLSGKIDLIGGGGINITNTPENKSGVKWGETKASKLGEALDIAANAGLDARANDAQLGQLEKLLPGMPTGADAKWADYLRSNWGITVDGADKLQAFNAIIDKLVPQQRLPGSGTMSDRDIEMFRNSLPSMLNDPNANVMIIQTLRGLNAYRKQLGDIAVKAGAMEDPDAARNFYYTEAAKLQNPLADFVAGAEEAAAAAGGGGGPAPGGPAAPVPGGPRVVPGTEVAPTTSGEPPKVGDTAAPAAPAGGGPTLEQLKAMPAPDDIPPNQWKHMKPEDRKLWWKP